MPGPSTPLAYAASRGSKGRLLVTRVVPVVVALSIALGAWLYRRPAMAHLNMLALQRRCLEYSPRQAGVVYDDDPANVPALSAMPNYVGAHRNVPRPVGSFALYRNRAFDAFRLRGPGAGRPVAAVAFMGRLTGPAGNERLVFVTLLVEPPNTPRANRFTLRPEVLIPRSLLSAGGAVPSRSGGPVGLELIVAPGDRTRIMEGRTDPTDPSHFTIDYVHNGVGGTVDGWLNADDSVTLGPRAGDVSQLDPTFHWWSPVPGLLARELGPVRTEPPVDASTRPVLPKRDGRRLRK